jgi:hypothetical protein
MHFPFNLLRIKSLYMFLALLAHFQEVLHKRHLVYCVRVMSVGCGTIAVNDSSQRRQIFLSSKASMLIPGHTWNPTERVPGSLSPEAKRPDVKLVKLIILVHRVSKSRMRGIIPPLFPVFSICVYHSHIIDIAMICSTPYHGSQLLSDQGTRQSLVSRNI